MLFSILANLPSLGCAVTELEVHGAPAHPFDAIVVPGCPSEESGALSGCQKERAAWASLLWKRGYARNFITSGAAVHSRFVEADAIATAMTALGVPAVHIYLERDALHTDENMWNSVRIARQLGFRTLGVASGKGHAAWGCRFLLQWGQPCGALSVDHEAVAALRPAIDAVLAAIRIAPVPVSEWLPIDERERREAVSSGRSRRPPSAILYPALFLMSLTDAPWIPHGPKTPPILTWADRLATLHASN